MHAYSKCLHDDDDSNESPIIVLSLVSTYIHVLISLYCVYVVWGRSTEKELVGPTPLRRLSVPSSPSFVTDVRTTYCMYTYAVIY